MNRSSATMIAAAVVMIVGCRGDSLDVRSGKAPLPGVKSRIALEVEGRYNATPSIAATGRVVAVAWGASAEGRTDVYVAVSRDGGATFGPPSAVDGTGTARLSGEMPPRVAVRQSAPDRFEITVLWVRRVAGDTSVMFARSLDGGASFTRPVALETPGAPGARGWPALAVDEGGVAHAVWLDHRSMASENGVPHRHGASSGAPDGVARAQKSSIYYRSIDSSLATPEQEISKGVCYCCKTAVAVSSRGDLYTMWRHVYPGNLRDMAFSAAKAGAPFSAPVRVSEDGWQIDGCPDDGPAIAVNRDGAAHVVWPTVISGAQPRGALFYAMTTDGGTFTRRVEVPTLGSLKPSHPQIAMDDEGRMVVAWDELTGDKRLVAARSIAWVPGGSPRFGPLVRLAEGATYYPVIAATESGFAAAWSDAANGSSIGVGRFDLGR